MLIREAATKLFYRKAGWKEIGTHGKGEIKFEMSFESWVIVKNNK